MPRLNNMFADHIAQERGAWEPQRANNAIIHLVLPSRLSGGNDAENLLILSLQSFDMPKEATNVSMLDYLNEQRKFAGRTTFDDVPVVFNDYVDQRTAETLRKWRQLVYDPYTGRVGLARDYKSHAIISQASPDGAAFVRETKLLGVWPSQFDPGSHDMSSDDVVKISVTFSFDKAYPTQTVASGQASYGSYTGPAGAGSILG